MKKILLRLKIAYYALFVYDHYFIINIKRKELKNMFLGNEFELDGFRCGLQEYNQCAIIKTMGNEIDDDEFILMKDEFEAMAESLHDH